MKIRPIVIAIVSLFTTSLAQAQYLWNLPNGMGPYFRAGVGPAFFQDGNLRGWSVGPGPSGKVSYDVGASGDAAIGFAFNRYVGLDFQTGYTWARINSVQNYTANNSSMANVPFLANVTLSLPIRHSNIIPYVGAGAGGSDSVFDAHSFSDTSGNSINDNEDDVVFAWQAFAGVRFMLNPNISMGVRYDFFMTGNSSFTYPLSGPAPNVNVEFEGVRTHSIMITLQANF